MSALIAQSFEDPHRRLPPHSIESEMCLVASMMLDRSVAEQVLPMVDGESFYLTDHRIVFDVIKELIVNGKPVDVVVIQTELEKRQVLSEIGGVAYLVRILETVPNAAHGPHYARIVREKALLRQMISLANGMIRRAFDQPDQPDQLLDTVAGEVFSLAEKRIVNPIEPLGQIAAEVYDQLEHRARKGIETKFWDLDDLLYGLQDGDLIVVAGRPSMGKTAFAMNIVQQIAQQHLPCVVFSLEMSKQQLALRMLCSLSNVNQERVRKGNLGHDEYQSLAKTVMQIRKLPIFVDDSPQLTILDLRTKARRLRHEQGIRCIMVDYMQLMHNPGPDSRVQQIAEISRGLKAIARELKVPVIALSQLNRASEQREGHKPRMSDLRESGSIEQDADVVMLLHREDYYHGEEDYQKTNVTEVIIAKQRNGPTGSVNLIFDGSTSTFKNKSAGDGVY
jgi:replicative DNA helicase